MRTIKATASLASFASDVEFGEVPAEVAHQSKRVILDTIGCMLAAASHDIGRIAGRHAISAAGAPEATVVGRNKRVPASTAAFANGSAGNALDLDESFLNFAHPGSVVVAAALAMAQRERVSGSELIAAVAVGYDIAARIGLSTSTHGLLRKPNISSVSWQTFGAAAAAGRLLALPAPQMMDAFGITGMYAPMPAQAVYEHEPLQLALTKYFPAGWAAQTGVTSALLADAGMTGPPAILDGDRGFWRMQGFAAHDDEYMLHDLGRKWWIGLAAFKPWPSCRGTHHYLTAFADLVSRHALDPAEIDSVIVEAHFDPDGYPPHRKFVATHPNGPIAMQFSLPFGLANVAYGLAPGLGWQDPRLVEDETMRRFRDRVHISHDPAAARVMAAQLEGEAPRRVTRLGGAVEVRTTSATYRRDVDYAKGDPWSPGTVLSDDDLVAKFKTVARDAAPGSPNWQRRLGAICEMVLDLEHVSDVESLAELLSP